MPVRLLSPRAGFVMVAALFLILAPKTVRPQPATHSGVFKMDASRSITIWQNHALSVGTQNVLITGCVTSSQGLNVTLYGGFLCGVGLRGYAPLDGPCRTGDVQVARSIDIPSAIGNVEGNYTVSTNLK